MGIVDLLAVVAPAIGGLGGLVGGSKVVHEGERGIKLRFGRAIRTRDGLPKIIKPGFIFVFPAVEKLESTHIRTRTLNLDTQAVMLKDKMVFNVSAVIMVRVKDTPQDIYQALFEVDNFEESIADYTTAVLRDVLTNMNYEQVLDPEKLGREVRDKISPIVDGWGVHVIDVMITDSSPSSETAKTILVTAEASLRVKAIQAARNELYGNSTTELSPTLAAAIIGTPVSVAITQ